MVQMVAGEIDWDQTKSDLIAAGVELRGAGADEAPGAYKRLDAVLGYHAGDLLLDRRAGLAVHSATPDLDYLSAEASPLDEWGCARRHAPPSFGL